MKGKGNTFQHTLVVSSISTGENVMLKIGIIMNSSERRHLVGYILILNITKGRIQASTTKRMKL